MSKICKLTDFEVNCTDLCELCLGGIYDDLREELKGAELAPVDAILKYISQNEFEALKKEGYIEHCRVDELGRHWYAI